MTDQYNDMGERMAARFAPDGAIWVCGACGKTHKDQYGIEGAGSPGWDESCMLHAILCHEGRHVSPGGMIGYIPFSQPILSTPQPNVDEGDGK